MKRADVVSGVVLAVSGSLAFFESLSLGLFTERGQTGPGFFPAVLSATLVLLALFLIANALRAKPSAPSADAPEDSADTEEEASIWRVAAAMGILVVSIAALEVLGFMIAMTFLMAALTIGLERRRVVGALAASIGFPALNYYLFGYVLGARLPTLLAG